MFVPYGFYPDVQDRWCVGSQVSNEYDAAWLPGVRERARGIGSGHGLAGYGCHDMMKLQCDMWLACQTPFKMQCPVQSASVKSKPERNKQNQQENRRGGYVA